MFGHFSTLCNKGLKNLFPYYQIHELLFELLESFFFYINQIEPFLEIFFCLIKSFTKLRQKLPYVEHAS